jgi:predicted phosphodiesterase
MPAMRIALVSDIHGNEVAFRAVLDDIDRVGVDQLICLGDVATLGPRPGFVLDELRTRRCPCILGNHDDFLVDAQLIDRYTEAPIIKEAVSWCRDQLSSAELEFVRTFKAELEVDLGDGAKLLLFHGSPRSHMEDVLATTPPDELDVFLDGRSATVMAGGHTHIQMLRQHRGILLVNPGSVGLAFKEYVAGRAPTLMLHAEYAIVEALRGAVSVSLRRVPLDAAALAAAVRPSDNPLRGMLLAEYARA